MLPYRENPNPHQHLLDVADQSEEDAAHATKRAAAAKEEWQHELAKAAKSMARAAEYRAAAHALVPAEAKLRESVDRIEASTNRIEALTNPAHPQRIA